MAGLTLLCILIVIVGTFSLMLISERCEVPWERKAAVSPNKVCNELTAEEIFNSIDWDTIEPDKVYAFNLFALGTTEDDEVDWWVE